MGNSVISKGYICCGKQICVQADSDTHECLCLFFLESSNEQMNYDIKIDIIKDVDLNSLELMELREKKNSFVEIFQGIEARQWKQYGELITEYSNAPLIFVHSMSENKYEIHLTDSNNSGNQVVRIIRDIIYSYVSEKVLVHGALCRYKGKGILIIGPKGAGKTTTLHYLMHLGAEYVSNDRVFIEVLEGRIIGHGFPLPIRVGYGTINSFREYGVYQNVNKESEEKENFSISEIVGLFDVNYIASSEINLILVPMHLETGFKELKRNEVYEILNNNDYSGGDPKFRASWVRGEQKGKIIKANLVEILDALEYRVFPWKNAESFMALEDILK